MKSLTAEERRARKAAYMRGWTRAHPESVLKTKMKKKARILELLGGARCVGCGCDEVRVLEINHIRGGGGKEARSHGRYWTPYDDIQKGRRSTEGLNVLCRICNAADYIYRKYPGLSGRWEIEWVPKPHPS